MPLPATHRRCSFPSSRWTLLLLVTLGLISCTGCNVVLLLGYLIGGPPSIEADFEAKTKKSLSGKNKTVVVYCYAPDELRWDHDKIDYEISKYVSVRLNNNDIRVIDPDRVYSWIDKHREFEKDADLGAEFKVDFVVKIELKEFSLFEEHSSDLYRGRCDAIISVLEMEKKEDGTVRKVGNVIYNKQVVSRFPTSGPVQMNQYPFEQFKGLYLSALSDEIGIKFYKSYAGDEYTRTALQ